MGLGGRLHLAQESSTRALPIKWARTALGHVLKLMESVAFEVGEAEERY